MVKKKMMISDNSVFLADIRRLVSDGSFVGFACPKDKGPNVFCFENYDGMMKQF